jgi:signal transduction histidine kinase
VRPTELLRTTTFRWTLAAFTAFVLALLLSLALIFERATAFEGKRIAALITQEADILASATPENRLKLLDERLRQDPRRIKPSGIFAGDGKRLIGNIEALPRGLRDDGVPNYVSMARSDEVGREERTVLATSRRLPNGDILVVGWDINYEQAVIEALQRGAAYGFVPAIALGLAAAIFLSARAHKRIQDVNTRVQRIIAGELRERLPTRGTSDPFDTLATIVNEMLGEMEMLIQRLAGVGDDIAHDLRTPLTHVRIGLERGRANAASLADLQAVVDKAMSGIDHAIAIVTALLRIREIEQTRRVAGFDDVWLGPLAREVGELYEPFAEEKRIAFKTVITADAKVRGDRDLLFEALTNLVDNAIKFTPGEGHVEVRLGDGALRVSDSGPGVTDTERDLVLQRFYRSDRSRHTKGLGLGLSLVVAIVKLHGFRLTIHPGPGFVAEIDFEPGSTFDQAQVVSATTR